MANITIRNIPEEVFEKIKRLSTLERRSLNNELLVIIEKGARTEAADITKSGIMIPRSVQVNLWKNLSTPWEDERTTEEIIRDIYSSRSYGRDIDL
jgi:plasmid stability protein